MAKHKDDEINRAIQASYTVITGEDILRRGFELARQLWNATWWAMFGYNEKLRRQRGDSWEAFRRRREKAPYPGYIGFYNEMRDHEAYRQLYERCASYVLRDFDKACRAWFANLRNYYAGRVEHMPHPPGYAREARTLTFETDRGVKHLGDWRFRITILNGRTPERYAEIQIHVRPGVKVAEIKNLRLMPDGRASLIYEAEPAVSPGDHVAGLDLGIINLGALVFDTGESILYSGRGLLDTQRFHEKRAARCEPSGWEPGKEHLPPSERKRTYQRRLRNIRTLAVHNLTTSIIRECVKRQVGTLVVGELRNIRDGKDYGDAANQKLHQWPFGQIQEQLRWKGEEVGIKVIEVSEAYTSQRCSHCGLISPNNRCERGLYVCRRCGLVINADINGALNILHKVSPEAIKAFGVGADLPGPPSPVPEAQARAVNRQTSQHVANHPVWVAKFDLRDWRIVMTRQVVESSECNTSGSGSTVGCIR